MKNKIFSGRGLNKLQRAMLELNELNRELKKAGLPDQKAGGRKTEDVLKAAEKARERLSEEKQRKEEIKRKKSTILSAVTSYRSKAIRKKSALDIIYAALDPDERDTLRSYDSDSMIAIAEEYALSPYDTLDEAINAFEAQQQEAFAEMDEDDYETNWEGIPLF